MEKIILFPIKDIQVYNIIQNNALLNHNVYGICCQNNIDENGYGPYGFISEKVFSIIDRFFCTSVFYRKDKNKTFISNSFPGRNFNIFGLESYEANTISTTINDFLDELKIKSLYDKFSRNYVFKHLKPFEANLFLHDKPHTTVINKLIDDGLNIAYDSIFYDTIVLFSANIEERIKNLLKSAPDIVQMLKSEEDLKDW
jgi:hypothetical protein